MYLKSLEISGFKSFARKTHLELSPGVNAVVGPNGCGKSNILDSIRWVLGEQRTSTLRSRAMDEVIFAGNDNFKPAGMAQVSISIDNSMGIFPTDLPEVQITRRLFRDGNGQYLLGDRTRRLKDIQEIIADTGIGQGALFVLSGREVEQVLSPNSSDRRAILEETAGINRYQIRKKDTLRKLETTRENISRLNDILQEVERQVEMAKKQLAKLNRYEKTRKSLSTSECRLLYQEMAVLESQRAEVQNLIDSLLEDLKKIDIEIEKVGSVADSLENRRKALSATLEKSREELSGESMEEGKLTARMDVIKDRIAQARRFINELEENNRRLEERRLKIQEILAESNEKSAEDTRFINEEKERIKDLSAEYMEKEKEWAGFRSEFETLKTRLSGLEEERKILGIQRENALRNLERAKSDSEGLSARRKARETELADLQKKMAEIDTSLSDTKMMAESSNTGLKSLLEQYNDLQARSNQLETEQRELKSSLYQKKSELSVMEREEEGYRGFSEAFQRVMKAGDRLPQLTPVHTVIQVSPQYETAIDVVLGGHFQSIITRNKRDANTCIDFLKKERAGRLTFFPLDMDRSGGALPVMPGDMPGIVGWARDLVECDSLYRDIIDIICGKTLVVRDLDSAYKIYERQKSRQGFIPRLVTLDGDVLDFSGAVTGGRFRTDRTQILARRRIINDLEREISGGVKRFEKISSQLADVVERQKKVSAEKQEKARQCEVLSASLRDLNGEMELGRKRIDMVQREIDEMEESSRRPGEILEQINGEITDLDEKTVRVNTDIETESRKLLQVEEAYNTRLQAGESARRELESRRKELEERKLQEGIRVSKIASEEQNLAQTLRDMERNSARMEEKTGEIREMENELQDYKNKCSILSLKLKGLKRAVDSTREDIAGVETALDERKSELVRLSENKNRLEERHNQKKINLIEINSRSGYQKERIREFSHEIRQSAKSMPPADIQALRNEIEELREKLNSFETVNFSAREEFDEHNRRYEEMKAQIQDLQDSSTDLRKIVRDMDSKSLMALESTMDLLNERFLNLFLRVFGGGSAGVAFTDPENKLESGVDITVQPPGKRASSISLLSSGEKSLTAITFLFALLSIKPGPFVILDELDAPLDEANNDRINALIKDFSQKSQFIVITHNRKTMEIADRLFGITMEEAGVSKLVSVKMIEAESTA